MEKDKEEEKQTKIRRKSDAKYKWMRSREGGEKKEEEEEEGKEGK